jgi:hypothetical protein
MNGRSRVGSLAKAAPRSAGTLAEGLTTRRVNLPMAANSVSPAATSQGVE